MRKILSRSLLYKNIDRLIPNVSTVKPPLTVTSEKRSPLNNGQISQSFRVLWEKCIIPLNSGPST